MATTEVPAPGHPPPPEDLPGVPRTLHTLFAYEPTYALPLSMLAHLERAREDDRRGDERALDALLQRIHRPVRQALAGRFRELPNAGDAVRDVALDVLTKVAGGIYDCRAEGDRQVWRWVWTVVERARIDYLRRELPRLSHLLIEEEMERVLGVRSWRDWREALDQEPASGEAMLMRHLMESYEAMPEETAQLIWHRVVLSASYEDIARAFGTTVSAAKRRWQRARRSLKKSVLRRIETLTATPDRQAAIEALAERSEGGVVGRVA